jgi:hypothetical protein
MGKAKIQNRPQKVVIRRGHAEALPTSVKKTYFLLGEPERNLLNLALSKRISLEDLRKVLGLESVKDAEGNIIQEAALLLWANFRQRALDTAILEITTKTDLKIAIESLERSKHRRVAAVTFSLQEQAVPKRDQKGKRGK